jgi:hypothetical protein
MVLDAILTMNIFYIFGSLQFASVFVLGFPFSVAFMTREKAPHSSGWLLLAPAFGATFYFSAGTILHSFGLQAFAVFWTLIGASTAASIVWLWLRRRSPLQIPLSAIWPCLLAAALALVLNSADLKFAGLDYFPLTNGDTFSYLGFIDQIRDTGWIAPRISYPAGYSPLIDHAIFTRAPSVIFSADFADVLGLETHSAFFLSQRIALPMIVLGASAIVIIATGSWMAALFCFAPLVFGNVLLHQILQQFNSCTMGTVIGPAIVALAIWTVRSERRGDEVVAGHALVGWACGAMALTSTEASPFYLMAFGIVALLPIFRDRQFTQMMKCGGAFVGAYLAACFPFVLKLWPLLIGQFIGAAKGHPGDWIASPGFLIQAAGVAFTIDPHLVAHAFVPRVTAVAVLVVFLVAIVMLGWSLIADAKPGPVLKTDRFVLFSIVLLVTALQFMLYARGVGYGLLKLTDYFAFLGSVVIAVAVYQSGLTRLKLAGRAVLTVVSAYCLVTFIEKQHILRVYIEKTALMPLPTAYRLDEEVAGKTVSGDLSAEPLDLFFYENRHQTAQILFRPSESVRYARSRGSVSDGPQYIARMPRVGVAGLPVADITYPALARRDILTVVPAAGQIHLLLPDPHWLAPEGVDAGQLRRWLSVSGKFVIFGPFADQRSLAVQVSAGPDLRPDNQIEVYLAGQVLRTITPNELPIRIDAPLPIHLGSEAEGEIRVVGLAAGIRQISVTQLRTVLR